MIVDEGDHGFDRRSSSARAKYADVFRRISLARDGADPIDVNAIDWDALAARVLAYLEATGSWGLISDWLSDTSPDGGGPPEERESSDPETIVQNHADQGTAGGDWHL